MGEEMSFIYLLEYLDSTVICSTGFMLHHKSALVNFSAQGEVIPPSININTQGEIIPPSININTQGEVILPTININIQGKVFPPGININTRGSYSIKHQY